MTDVETIIYNEVKKLFNTTQKITYQTTAFDIDGWDSLNYSTLIISLEDKLNIRLPEDEIFNLDNIGQLIELFKSEIKKKG